MTRTLTHTEKVEVTDGIRHQFEKLAEVAGFEMTKSRWDAYSYESGIFTFATRQHALGFMMIVDKLEGYAAQLLGPTNSVDVEIIFPDDDPENAPWSGLTIS